MPNLLETTSKYSDFPEEKSTFFFSGINPALVKDYRGKDEQTAWHDQYSSLQAGDVTDGTHQP